MLFVHIEKLLNKNTTRIIQFNLLYVEFLIQKSTQDFDFPQHNQIYRLFIIIQQPITLILM